MIMDVEQETVMKTINKKKDSTVYDLIASKDGKKVCLKFYDIGTLYDAKYALMRKGYQIESYDNFGLLVHGSVESAIETADLATR